MAAAHAQAERLLKEIALPHAVLRMPFVYGVGDRLGLDLLYFLLTWA